MPRYPLKILAGYAARKAFPRGVRRRVGRFLGRRLGSSARRAARSTVGRYSRKVYRAARKKGLLNKYYARKFSTARKVWRKNRTNYVVTGAAGVWATARSRNPGRQPTLRSYAKSKKPKRPVGRPRKYPKTLTSSYGAGNQSKGFMPRYAPKGITERQRKYRTSRKHVRRVVFGKPKQRKVRSDKGKKRVKRPKPYFF